MILDPSRSVSRWVTIIEIWHQPMPRQENRLSEVVFLYLGYIPESFSDSIFVHTREENRTLRKWKRPVSRTDLRIVVRLRETCLAVFIIQQAIDQIQFDAGFSGISNQWSRLHLKITSTLETFLRTRICHAIFQSTVWAGGPCPTQIAVLTVMSLYSLYFHLACPPQSFRAPRPRLKPGILGTMSG